MALPFYHCTGIITKPASAKEKTVHFAKGFYCFRYIFSMLWQKTIRQELPRRGKFAYLKLVKNKPKTKGNDSLDDYDYGEEDSEEWETEDEESDEPDADGGSAENDDEACVSSCVHRDCL